MRVFDRDGTRRRGANFGQISSQRAHEVRELDFFKSNFPVELRFVGR